LLTHARSLTNRLLGKANGKTTLQVHATGIHTARKCRQPLHETAARTARHAAAALPQLLLVCRGVGGCGSLFFDF